MPVELQAKLLRVIQEGVVQRIGSTVSRKIDVRIISALNEKPETCLNQGILRHDLFYRLNVVYLELPPLRERKNDISILTEHFINHLNESFHKKVIGFTPEAEQMLYHYDWPGNIRELKHAIEHSMNFADSHTFISPELLPKHIMSSHRVLHQRMEEITTVPPLRKALHDYENQIIESALKQTSGNIQQAAKLLQVPRQTLQYKLKQK
jgi:arginine utilization regulatory protein